MMFTKLKNAFLGRNYVSKKLRNEIANYLVVEHKLDRISANYLAESGEWKDIVEASK